MKQAGPPALVLWSDDESLESIKSTLQAMGLEIARLVIYIESIKQQCKQGLRHKQRLSKISENTVAGVVAACAYISAKKIA